MFILSSCSYSSPPSSYFIGPRVPFSSLYSPSSFFAVSFKSSSRRRFACPCLSYSLKAPAMAEPISDNDSSSSSSSSSSISTSGVSAIAMDSAGERKETEHSRTFLNVSTEQDLLLGIKKEMEGGKLSSNVASGLEDLYHNYKNAVFKSGNPKADEIVLSNMAAAFDRILSDVEDPFVFSPHHKALREPFDYYKFGQNYIRPLVDFRNSYVGNISIFNEMEQYLLQGHNVVLISNHQSEADPAAIALLLETTNLVLAENMIYVAGDRVLTDPLCKPFSMGRNLICVYSKKHMNDAPELAEAKRKANTKSLKEMALLLRGGSKIVWIAPSGGRDRPDPLTEEWHPAPFDASAVDNMRRLVEHSGAPGHIYPLALLCYDIMPPPLKVEKEIGEKRVISFHGVGLSVAPEVRFSELAALCEVPEESKDAYTQALYQSVTEQYNILKFAIHGKQGLKAATPGVSLSQPWN